VFSVRNEDGSRIEVSRSIHGKSYNICGVIRLQKQMDEALSTLSMTEQDRQISQVVAEERPRLRNFIRRRVPDPSDVEDIVQDVFYELVEANAC